MCVYIYIPCPGLSRELQIETCLRQFHFDAPNIFKCEFSPQNLFLFPSLVNNTIKYLIAQV